MDTSAFFPYPDADMQAIPGFLVGVRDEDITAILSYTQSRRYNAGDLAIKQGDSDRSLFIITSGRFEVVVHAGRIDRQMHVNGPGDIFGELSFFDGQPRSADVRAMESAEALILTAAGFERLRIARPQLALTFVLDLSRIVSTRYRLYSNRLAVLEHL